MNQHSRLAPILFLDVDGVLSLYGFDHGEDPPGHFHSIDGIHHCIGHQCADRLRRLAGRFELVWATGWEEKANEYLPFILGLEGPELHTLSFDGRVAGGSAHWKIEAIEEYAQDRPAAWIDDNLDRRAERWAERRTAPTLLVPTDPAVGLDEEHVDRLLEWANAVMGKSAGAEERGDVEVMDTRRAG